MIESAQTILGGMKKSSMIESAQTILGGIKENSQSSKVPMQSWGAWKKSKGSENFEQKSSQCNDAQDQMKKKQRERAQAQHWGAPWTILQIKF